MVGLIRPPKNHRSWIPSCGSSVGHIWKAWSRFFGFRAKKRAETAKTADFGPKSSFLAQKWLDVLNPFWSSEMHQIWSICMILPKKLAYGAKLDIFGLFIYQSWFHFLRPSTWSNLCALARISSLSSFLGGFWPNKTTTKSSACLLNFCNNKIFQNVFGDLGLTHNPPK